MSAPGVCVCRWISQERIWGRLSATMCVFGADSGSSERTVYPFICWVISPVPPFWALPDHHCHLASWWADLGRQTWAGDRGRGCVPYKVILNKRTETAPTQLLRPLFPRHWMHGLKCKHFYAISWWNQIYSHGFFTWQENTFLRKIVMEQ